MDRTSVARVDQLDDVQGSMMTTDLTGLRFGILGLGKSGIGAAGLIKRLGGTALISDRKPLNQFGAILNTLHDAGIEVEAGGHERLFSETFDILVVSPGAVLTDDWIDALRIHSTKIWSELELASHCTNAKWIGVTGSNGKTTTVTLLTDMLNEAGYRARAVGNIGTAWSECLPDHETDIFVVEVSSFQLEYTHSARPNVCVLLNVLENHLDRHGNIDTYGRLKLKLAANQTSEDVVVLNAEDRFLTSNLAGLRAQKRFFSRFDTSDWSVDNRTLSHRSAGDITKVLDSSEWTLVGEHNLLNAAAAAAAASSLGITDRAIHDALVKARPVEHRIEFVREICGVKYVNDSKSTNLTATLTALRAIDGPTILLFGGRPKHESFAPLSDLLETQIRHLIAFGEATGKVKQELRPSEGLHYCDALPESLALAVKLANPGETVILSPGCASYDQFSNFEQRGELFKELVLKL